MDKVLNEGQLPERFSKSDRIQKGSDGWLSPSGDFYKANSDEHKELADWIVKNNLAAKPTKRFGRLKSNLESQQQSGLSEREYLFSKGWVLINGPVFHTGSALNYTTSQLEKLSEVGIPIVGAYDGSREFSSRETLDWVKKAVSGISDFVERQKIQVLVFSPSNGYEPKEVSQTKFWEDIKNRGYSTLKDFEKDPFNTVFKDFGMLSFTGIRDVLTKGYQDEMVFDEGQETYMFRLVRLNSGERVCVEYTFHHHDRDSGNEERMNAYVVDNFTFGQKINKYISLGINPKIEGDYFRKLIESK
jgi:hypothetical protein